MWYNKKSESLFTWLSDFTWVKIVSEEMYGLQMSLTAESRSVDSMFLFDVYM